MTATCKYCGSQAVKWNSSNGGWRMLNTDGSGQHRCLEYEAAHPKSPSVAKKKKTKTGAFLRWYGPRSNRVEALLVETAIPHPDTPAGLYLEPVLKSWRHTS